MFNRALEASAEENAARMKRKRCEAQSEICSPADWVRQDDWPVGIRNVGNTCWFSAVIQVRANSSLCIVRKIYHLTSTGLLSHSGKVALPKQFSGNVDTVKNYLPQTI